MASEFLSSSYLSLQRKEKEVEDYRKTTEFLANDLDCEADDWDDSDDEEEEADDGETLGPHAKSKEVAGGQEDFPTLASQNVQSNFDESNHITDQFGALSIGSGDDDSVDQGTSGRAAESDRRWQERNNATDEQLK